MQHIRSVIKETMVPSWVNSVPYNYRDASAGVLKADEWWNLGTIYFLIALISLWSKSLPGSIPNAAGFHHVLDHTMFTVSVISLACMHIVTQACSDAYLSCMTKYLQDLQEIHLHASFVPYYRMVLHLPHFFHSFGPTCSWWCFPYEYLIGQIQQLLSNHKISE